MKKGRGMRVKFEQALQQSIAEDINISYSGDNGNFTTSDLENLMSDLKERCVKLQLGNDPSSIISLLKFTIAQSSLSISATASYFNVALIGMDLRQNEQSHIFQNYFRIISQILLKLLWCLGTCNQLWVPSLSKLEEKKWKMNVVERRIENISFTLLKSSWLHLMLLVTKSSVLLS